MEYSSFVKVPREARSFSFLDQFVFWFAATSLPAAWTYGALMAGWIGIPGALLLIFVVSTLSFLPWAYLGRIAQETGGSSMAIVRPTFGIRGSIVPSFFYLIFGFGWAAVNVFIGAIALSFIMAALFGLPSYLDSGNTAYMAGYVAIISILQAFFAMKGHETIKRLQWVATIFFLLLGLYMTYLVFTTWDVGMLVAWRPEGMLTTTIGPFVYPLTFTVLVDLLIAYNWTWEFIGDFSRFAKTKRAGVWGPFMGANLAQYWWFLVGAFSVIAIAIATGTYNPLLADPSSTAIALGVGWIAALVVLFATITTNAGNIYASALGISNIVSQGKEVSLKKLLVFSALFVIPIALIPLISTDFIGFFIFFLDVLGAIVVPLWVLTLVDYFFVKKGRYTDDMFNKNKDGAYWYTNGWNIPAMVALIVGVVLHWLFAYVFVEVREAITAALPTAALVAVLYLVLTRKK